MTIEKQAIAALVADLVAALDSHAPKREAALRAREKRLEKMGSDLNDGLMPTLDSQGRLHAPCDGYAWTWEVEGHINREPFLAGEFLPCDSKHEATRRFRVKGARRHECIPLGLADAVQGACAVLREHEVPFDLSSGQPFESRQWGEEVAHVYAETPSAEAHEILAAFFDSQVYAQRRAEIEEREKAEREAYENAEPCPEGRVEITGTLLAVKNVPNAWGGALRCLVRDDRGFKVWGSLPYAISAAEIGDRLTFAAAVTPADEDPKFGFFKRPTKAQLLTTEAA